MENQPLNHISVSILNSHFVCVACFSSCERVADFLNKPNHIAVRSIPIAFRHGLGYLRGEALRNLARLHHVKAGSPERLREFLAEHICSSDCEDAILIFRRLAEPRQQLRAQVDGDGLLPLVLPVERTTSNQTPIPANQAIWNGSSVGSIVGDGTDILQKDWHFRKFSVDYVQGVNDVIAIRNLNQLYTFHSMVTTTDGTDLPSLLADSGLLVVEDQPSVLVQAYGHFTVKSLRALARMHSIRYHNQPSHQLQLALASHVCTSLCTRHFTIFKLLSNPRRFIEAKRHQNRIERPVGTSSSSGTQIPPSDYQAASGLTGDADAHLRPCSAEQMLKIITQFQAKMSLSKFLREPCAVCSRLSFASNLSKKHASAINLHILRNDHLPPSVHPKSYNFEGYDRAILCANGLEDRQAKGLMSICHECIRDLERDILPKFALANWLYIGRDCLPVIAAKAFSEATPFERVMVARARTNGLCFRFTDSGSASTLSSSKSETPWTANKIRGNVVATPLDAVRMNEILPPSPQSIYDTICALFVGQTKPAMSTIRSLHPILARKSRIKTMLEFLLKNNHNYRPDEQFQGISLPNLELLHKQGDQGVPTAVEIAFLEMNDAVEGATSSYSEVASNTPNTVGDETHSQLLMENVGYTLGDTSRLGYREMKLAALEHCLQGKPFVAQKAGATPLPDFHNPKLLSWLFPHLDPFGIAGFHHPSRARYISMEEQVRYFLQIEDSSFEEDPEFAFVFYNIIRKKQVSETLRFRVPVAKYANLVDRIVHLDQGRVMELEEKLRRDPACASLDESEKEILQILQALSPVAKNIPGSAATRISMRNEIRALINYRGPPTLFITINPSDIHNPIVSVLANRCSTMESIEKILEHSTQQRLLASIKRPAASAMFFSAMMDAFVKIILGHNQQGSSSGVYGVCDAYYGTVEVQGRGSLHCHLLVWLRGHLPPERLKERLIQDAGYRAKVIAWVDCIMESDFLSLTNRDCYLEPAGSPKNRSSPASKFESGVEYIHKVVEGLPSDPHPGCLVEPQASQMSAPEFWNEYGTYVNELLLRYNWHRHCATCWKYLKRGQPRIPQNCRFGLDGTTIPQTSVDEATGRLVVSRTQPMMTSFTSLVLFLLKCNMDIKFIGSGLEAKAFMYYVTDYITKSPLPTHQGLAALVFAIQKSRTKLQDLQFDSPSLNNIQSAITIAVNSILGHTEFSKTQVLYQLLGGDEWITNEQFCSVNWGNISKYVYQFWTLCEENNLHADSPHASHPNMLDTTPDANICITPTSGHVTISSHRLDYIHRPYHYSSVGLYNYFSTTRKYAMHRGENGPTPTKNQHLFSSEDHPQYRTHAVSSRKHSVIPILLGPNLARSTSTDAEKESWARDMLILFKPWRVPADLKYTTETWVEAMERFEPELSEADRQRITHMSALAEGREARSQFPRRARCAEQFEASGDLFLSDAAAEEPLHFTQGEQNVYLLGFSRHVGVDDDQVLDTPPTGSLDQPTNPAILDLDVTAAFDQCYRVPQEHSKSLVDDSQRTRPEVMARAQQQYERLKGIDNASGDEDDGDSADEDGAASSSSEESHTLPSTCEADPEVSISNLGEHTETCHGDQRRIQLESRFKGHASLVNSIALKLKDNREQLRAFYIIAEHIVNGGPQLLLYIGGMGGTGKSFVVNAIVELFDKLQRRHELVIGAPTGIAAALIGGSTLHSLILANPAQKTHRSEGLAEIWMPIRYMVVDEVSMIGARFLAELSSRIQVGKADIPWARVLPFGGISVIFTGDFCQLTPPRQKSLFSHELVHSPSFSESRGVEGINNLAGAYLWRQVRVVVLLKKNHRQGEDPEYARILALIRKGAGASTEGNSRQNGNIPILTCLRQRVIQQVRHHSPHTLSAFKDAPVIVGSKRLRDLLNVRLIRAHAAREGKEVHLYYSRDTIRRREVTNKWVRDYLWSLPSRWTRDSFGILPLFVGMRVMVTENIAVTHRAVNGAEGVVVQILYTEGVGGHRLADVVYVRIPGSGVHLRGLPKDVIPIFPTPTQIKHTLKISTSEIKSFTRRQCPLIPAYSYTDYKSQGRSLDRAVVDLASARSQEGVYVMLSRVRSLEGVLILRWFPGSKVTERLSGELREELSRLEELDKSTASAFPFFDFKEN